MLSDLHNSRKRPLVEFGLFLTREKDSETWPPWSPWILEKKNVNFEKLRFVIPRMQYLKRKQIQRLYPIGPYFLSQSMAVKKAK